MKFKCFIFGLILLSACSLNSLHFDQTNLPRTGQLRQKPNAYTYLKLDDVYFDQLLPVIQKHYPLAKRPPGQFLGEEDLGAHVSVFYEREAENIKIKELNEVFNFALSKLKKVHANSIDYYVMVLKAPALSRIRQTYDLSPKLNNHDFHVTIACSNSLTIKK